jgi:hypothetical protein
VTRTRSTLAFAGLLALTGCAEMGQQAQPMSAALDDQVLVTDGSTVPLFIILVLLPRLERGTY